MTLKYLIEPGKRTRVRSPLRALHGERDEARHRQPESALEGQRACVVNVDRRDADDYRVIVQVLHERPGVCDPLGAVDATAAESEVLAQGEKKRALVIDDEDALAGNVHRIAHSIGADEARKSKALATARHRRATLQLDAQQRFSDSVHRAIPHPASR
ncbi:MAG: hypothetical protein IT359_08235 [Gemmatimonadaceae bacterium]|nr:hypothetical protein [Gemmatimonadaceae bacterium]